MTRFERRGRITCVFPTQLAPSQHGANCMEKDPFHEPLLDVTSILLDGGGCVKGPSREFVQGVHDLALAGLASVDGMGLKPFLWSLDLAGSAVMSPAKFFFPFEQL